MAKAKLLAANPLATSNPQEMSNKGDVLCMLCTLVIDGHAMFVLFCRIEGDNRKKQTKQYSLEECRFRGL